MRSFINFDIKDLRITDLAMIGFYNSWLLSGLVDISPRLKRITADLGEEYLLRMKFPEGTLWASWEATELSPRAISLL